MCKINLKWLYSKIFQMMVRYYVFVQLICRPTVNKADGHTSVIISSYDVISYISDVHQLYCPFDFGDVY